MAQIRFSTFFFLFGRAGAASNAQSLFFVRTHVRTPHNSPSDFQKGCPKGGVVNI